MVTLVVISWCAQVPGRPRGAVRRFVASSLAKHMPAGGGGGGGGGVGIYAGAVVIALAPLASLASSVVNFEFSGATYLLVRVGGSPNADE